MNLSSAILFFLLLYFISPVCSQIDVCKMCSEANQTKQQLKIAVIFDWNTNLTLNSSASCNNQFSSSPMAQEVVSYTAALNNDSQILPEHEICLWIVFYRYSLQEVQYDLPILLGKNEIRAVVNVLMHELTFSKQTIVLRNYFPLVNIKPHTHEECSVDLKDIGGEHSHQEDTIPTSFTNLDIVPTLMELLHATRMFTTFMGWQRVGFITECTEFQQQQNGTIFFTVYNPKDFVTMFKNFAENEIRIFVFVGNLTNYLHLIKSAFKMGVTKQGFVWIYPNVLPDLDIVEAINSMNYSADERQQVYDGLKGTITIHPSGDVNRTIAKTSDSTSSYIDDAIKLLAIAGDSFLRKKANETGTALRETSITWSDSPEYGRQIAVTSFTGKTGEIGFGSDMVRNMSVFRFNNILSCHYMNESGRTGCNISCIGEIYKGTNDSVCEVKFFDENSTTGFTKQSTIVFSDGTKDIPPDSLSKFFNRTTFTTFLINFSILILFVLVFAFFLGIVCFRDLRSMIYDDSWQFTEKVVDYGLEPEIKDPFSSNTEVTEQVDASVPSSGFLINKVFHNTGRIGGKLVFMKEVNSNVVVLTKKFRKHINQILKIKHPNLCYFLGCIVDGNNITTILHEHCLRGSLHDVIMNPHIELNWKFRLSFINDVAMGLGHLHSCKIINGNLTTKTCVVDSNWVLKLTDYGLNELHGKRKSKKTNDAFNCVSWEAYECRTLFGGEHSFASDVYCLGMIMKVLYSRNCLLMYKDDFKTESIKLTYDDKIPSEFVHLLNDCITQEPKYRPKIDIVKNKLKKVFTMDSSDFLGITDIYSNKLEEVVEKCQEELELEKEHSNAVFGCYIPKTAVTGIRKKVHPDYRLKEFHHLALLSVGLHDVEKIKENRTKSDIAAIIAKIDGIVSGVATTMSLERIQATGNHWVLVVELYSNLSLDMAIHRAVGAAITMTQNFKRTDQLCDVPLQTAIHTGSLMCGFVDNNSLFHVAIGRTLQTLLKLMLHCPDGAIIVTHDITQTLTDDEFNFEFKDTDVGSAYLLSKQTDTPQWSFSDTNKEIKEADSKSLQSVDVDDEQSTHTPEKKCSMNQKMVTDNDFFTSELPGLVKMSKTVEKI